MQVEGGIHINEDSEAVDSLSDMRADDRKPASPITSDVLNNSNNTNVLNSGSEKPVKLHEKTAALDTGNLNRNSVDMSITEIEENPSVSTVLSLKVKHPETGNSIQFGDADQEINSKQDLCNGVNTFVTGSSVGGSKSTKLLSEDINMEPVVGNVKTECSSGETFEELPWRDVKPVIIVKHENDLNCGTNDELANTCTDNSNEAGDVSVNDCRPDVENSTSAQNGEVLDVNCVEPSPERESDPVNHLSEKYENSDATKNVDNHNHLNKSNSVSSQEMNTHFSKDIPVDSEDDELDKTQDPEDIAKTQDQAKVGEKIRLSNGDTEKISDTTTDDDDDIIIVSDIVKSEPVSKYSFKNILQMPNSYARNEGISNSKRNDTLVDKSESQPVKDTMQQKSAGGSKAESQPVKDTVQQKSAGGSKAESHPVKDTVQQKPAGAGKGESQPAKDTMQQKPAGASKVKSEKFDVDDSLNMVDSATGALDNESASNKKRIQNERFMRSSAKRVKLEPENEEYSDDPMSDADWIPPEKKSVKRTRNGHSSNQKGETSVVISSEVLQSIIALRVNTAIKKQKQANLERLSLRTRGMLTASGLWKETVKHLERSVQELSSLNQKLEKQKTQLVSVKETSSPVKAQDPAGTKFPLLQPQTGHNQVQPSSSSPAQQSSALSTQAPIRRRPGRPIKTYPTQPAPPSIPPAAAAATPSPSLQPVSTPPARPAQTTIIKTSESPPQSGPFINLIDLTDEEDSARKRNTHVQISNPVLSQQLVHSTNKILSPGQTGVSPIGNGYIQQGPVRQGSSSNLANSNKSPVVSSQILSPVNSMVDISGSQYQLVTISGSSIPQNGTILALLPGSAANASVIPKQPEITASTRSVPIHSVADTALASTAKTSAISLQPSYILNQKQHPAPLPPIVDVGTAPPHAKNRPPKPTLRISRVAQGIVLSWNMLSLVDVEKIATYQLFAYQESEVATSRSNLWKKVGEVNALPLPMACTLTQFQAGNKYHFSVRAVDQYGRCGSYSDPSSIYLGTDP